MEKQLLILIISLLPIVAFGQKKYTHKYRQHLTPQQSSFSIQTIDSTLEERKSIITFQILDKNEEELSFINIRIKNNILDTIIHSDYNGLASAMLSPGTFSIAISTTQFTPILLDNFIVKENTKTNIKTVLGKSNMLAIVCIYSVRKLTVDEINKLVDDLSNKRKDNKLIKNKTCYVMWEI